MAKHAHHQAPVAESDPSPPQGRPKAGAPFGGKTPPASSGEPIARTIGRLALLFVAPAVGTANITLVVALSPSIEESLGLGHAGFGILISASSAATLVIALAAG